MAAERSSARQWRRSEYDLFELFCGVCADLLWHDPQDLIAYSYSPLTIQRIEPTDCRAKSISLCVEAVPERGILILLDVDLVRSASVPEIGPRDINLKTACLISGAYCGAVAVPPLAPEPTACRSATRFTAARALPPDRRRLLRQTPALGNQLTDGALA
jgi:hypothetical protein